MKNKKFHKQNKFSSYYTKKLNTDSSCSSNLKSDVRNIEQLIEKQISNLYQSVKGKNKKMIKTKIKRKQIDNEQMIQRDLLRKKLEKKMNETSQNIEKIKSSKQSLRSQRSKAQQTTRSRFKNMQNIAKKQSFLKSRQNSISTEQFFQELLTNQKKLYEKAQKNSNYCPHSSFAYTSKAHQQSRISLSHNLSDISRMKKFPKLLKVSALELKQKKQKRDAIQKKRKNHLLQQYARKMDIIVGKRQNLLKIPKPTIPRKPIIVPQLKSRYINPKNNKSSRIAIHSKGSFSQLYKKKLRQKHHRRQMILSLSLKSGEQILQRQHEKRIQNKFNRLIKDTTNEVKRKLNFKIMQHLLQKK